MFDKSWQRSTALATRGNKTAPATHAREARPPTLEFVEPLVYDFGKMPQVRKDSHRRQGCHREAATVRTP